MEINQSPQSPQSSGAKRLSTTQAQRAAHVAAWERSGMSAAEYARAHGLRLGNLYAWRRKCAEPAPSASAFVPVRIGSDNSAATGRLRIVLIASGLECVIEGAGTAQAFASLAGALKREVFDV